MAACALAGVTPPAASVTERGPRVARGDASVSVKGVGLSATLRRRMGERSCSKFHHLTTKSHIFASGFPRHRISHQIARKIFGPPREVGGPALKYG